MLIMTGAGTLRVLIGVLPTSGSEPGIRKSSSEPFAMTFKTHRSRCLKRRLILNSFGEDDDMTWLKILSYTKSDTVLLLFPTLGPHVGWQNITNEEWYCENSFGPVNETPVAWCHLPMGIDVTIMPRQTPEKQKWPSSF